MKLKKIYEKKVKPHQTSRIGVIISGQTILSVIDVAFAYITF